jgi:predicted metal-dependent hydrolase
MVPSMLAYGTQLAFDDLLEASNPAAPPTADHGLRRPDDPEPDGLQPDDPEPVSDKGDGADDAPFELDPEPAPEPRPQVEIRTSTRRRKTVDAHWEGDTIVVVVPQRLPKRDRQHYADELAARLIKARRATHPTDEALTERARGLARRYLDGAVTPTAVRWSSRQRTRWGSCSLDSGAIRISDTLKGVPGWVLDAVLVHELAHLLHAQHDAAFHELVARYPRTADADHFLAGYQLGLAKASASSD